MTNGAIRKQLELALRDLSVFVHRPGFYLGVPLVISCESVHEEDIAILRATHKPGQLGRISREEFEQVADVYRRLGRLYNELRDTAA